jgi:hypothetical protein
MMPDTERWAIESYGLRASEMKVYDLGDGKSHIQWHASDRAYDALVGAFNDGRLVIRVSWESQNPVLSEILQCYGPPAAYQAGYEPAPVAGTSLYLYYPQTGLVIDGRRNTTNRSIGNGFEMSTATFIAPAKSAVDMLPAIHSPPGNWPRFSEAASLRSWPADLRDIVLDVHPAYQ